MQRRTYPFAFVILSPGSKIGHTPRKNPSALIRAAATSRIIAYRGWCRTPVLHQPFAAKKYDTICHCKMQVFFQQIVKYFLKNSAFCQNSFSGLLQCSLFIGIIFYRCVLYTLLRKSQVPLQIFFTVYGTFFTTKPLPSDRLLQYIHISCPNPTFFIYIFSSSLSATCIILFSTYLYIIYSAKSTPHAAIALSLFSLLHWRLSAFLLGIGLFPGMHRHTKRQADAFYTSSCPLSGYFTLVQSARRSFH